jgi:hypothetical protein
VRQIIDHSFGGCLWITTFQTEELTRAAPSATGLTAIFEKVDKIAPVDQMWPLVRQYREPCRFDPVADRVAVDAKRRSSLVDCVAAQ